MIILIAQDLRLLFIFTSSHPANDQAIPSHTTARTPRRSTILITYRIILANTVWNQSIQLSIVHLYFLFATFSPQAASQSTGQDCHSGKLAQGASHTQVAPGTFSEVIVVIFSAFTLSTQTP